jgi:Aspartyl protease
MTAIDYPFSSPYMDVGAGLAPVLEVELFLAAASVRVLGVVDSGSTFTIFNPEYAQALEIDDLHGGVPGRVSTQAGPIDFYIFDMEMAVQLAGHVNRFPCRVGFFESRRPRNILGRNYIFRLYEIGFCDTRNLLRFRPEY